MKTKTALKIAGGALTLLALAAPFISEIIEEKLSEDELDEKIDNAVKKAIKNHEDGVEPEEVPEEEVNKNKEIAKHLRRASIALVVAGFVASKLGDVVDDKLLDIRIDNHIEKAQLTETTIFNL